MPSSHRERRYREGEETEEKKWCEQEEKRTERAWAEIEDEGVKGSRVEKTRENIQIFNQKSSKKTEIKH